jgi:hypothetical protein
LAKLIFTDRNKNSGPLWAEKKQVFGRSTGELSGMNIFIKEK